MTDTKKQQTLSESFSELEAITAEFERGDVDLEKGIPKFQRGLELARFLKKRLSQLENQIEEVKVQFKDVYEDKTQPTLLDADELEETGSNEDDNRMPF